MYTSLSALCVISWPTLRFVGNQPMFRRFIWIQQYNKTSMLLTKIVYFICGWLIVNAMVKMWSNHLDRKNGRPRSACAILSYDRCSRYINNIYPVVTLGNAAKQWRLVELHHHYEQCSLSLSKFISDEAAARNFNQTKCAHWTNDWSKLFFYYLYDVFTKSVLFTYNAHQIRMQHCFTCLHCPFCRDVQWFHLANVELACHAPCQPWPLLEKC